MTNEQYLHLSYFAAAAGGLTLVALILVILGGPNREATTGQAWSAFGKFLRRALPSWLLLAVILGFISVTYFDCNLETYDRIVADRDHLIDKSQEQTVAMSVALAAALCCYAVTLMLFMWAGVAARRPKSPKRPGSLSPRRASAHNRRVQSY